MTTPPISATSPATAPATTATSSAAKTAAKTARAASGAVHSAAQSAAKRDSDSADAATPAPTKFSTVLGAKVQHHAATAAKSAAAQTPHVAVARKVGKTVSAARANAPAATAKTET